MKVVEKYRNAAGQLVVVHEAGISVLEADGKSVLAAPMKEQPAASRLEAEIRAELAQPGNERVVAIVNEHTGVVRSVLVPKPYWEDKSEK